MTLSVVIEPVLLNTVEIAVNESDFTVELALVPIGAKGDVGDVNPDNIAYAQAAEDAATNAENSATSAAGSASDAALSESNAALSESSAANSASSATTSASEALSSKNAAQSSATNASSSESAAATSATNALASEQNAASSDSSAQSSANSASTSASTATTKASEASTSATNAASSATSASSSASTSSTQAGIATDKATEASGYASAASISATNSANSATSSASSASTATTQAGIATAQATNSSNSASAAALAKIAAETARDQTLTAFDNFDDRYLGDKSSDPSVDNDGNALVGGSLYFNSTDGVMKVYTGSSWVSAYASLSGALLVSSNLSDLNNFSSARTNLGLGNVDNTSDSNKPISTATQNALNTKSDTSHNHDALYDPIGSALAFSIALG